MNMNEIGQKVSKKDLNLVQVEWLDAMSDDNTWQELDELRKQKLRPVTCVGWLLTQNSEVTILISSFDEDSQCGGGGTVIPTNCVQKITKVREKNDDTNN
jgi:hypothetical protein|tara:strand:- start:860 stop:1159 length:300 start_codon:yes stop_codon:yes gene_type:complete